MAQRLRSYRFELAAVALGAFTAAALMPHGREAVFSVGALTAAALSAGPFLGRRQSLTRA